MEEIKEIRQMTQEEHDKILEKLDALSSTARHSEITIIEEVGGVEVTIEPDSYPPEVIEKYFKNVEIISDPDE